VAVDRRWEVAWWDGGGAGSAAAGQRGVGRVGGGRPMELGIRPEEVAGGS
jgi:hypothetical protein